MSEQLLPIAKIRRDPELQMRLREDPATLERYTEHLFNQDDPTPPEKRLAAIVVFVDQDGQYLLADGFHTLAAAERAGLTHFLADVRPGGREQALLFALGANAKHGLPRNLGDRLKSVGTALKEFGERDDAWIARATHTKVAFVKKIRAELQALADESAEPEEPKMPAGPTAAEQLRGLSEQEKRDRIEAAEESDEERTKPCNSCYGNGTCPRCEGSGICSRCGGTNKVMY